MLRFLKDLGTPPPRALYSPAEFVLNAGLRRAFEQEVFDFELIESLLEEAKLAGVTLNSASLEMVLRRRIEKAAERLYTARFHV